MKRAGSPKDGSHSSHLPFRHAATDRWTRKFLENIRRNPGPFTDEGATSEEAIAQFDQLKVLGHGDLSKKLTVTAHRFSKQAREKIEKAGGQVVVIAPPAARVKSSVKSAGTAAKK